MPEEIDESSAWQGVGLAFLATIGWAVVLAAALSLISAPEVTDVLLEIALAGAGLVQLIYLVPLGIWLRKRGKRNAFKGVAIFVSVVFLLNASCFGLIFLH